MDYLSLDKRVIWACSLVALMLATVAWYGGMVFFLRESAEGPVRAARWLGLNVLAIPVFAFAFHGLYHVFKQWWVIELPYWLISIVVSYLFFARVAKLTIGWHELAAAGLVIVIAFLLGSKP